MKELKIPLLILFVVLELLLLLFIKSNNEIVEDFSLNLITEIIGIFLTVLLIDLVIKRREKKEKKNILKNAYSQYRIPAQKLLSFFAIIYKASSKEKPPEWNTDFKTLLTTEEFYDSITHLDFLKKAPVSPTTDWINFSRNEVEEVTSKFEKIIEKYAFVLDSKIIADLEWLENHWILNILSSGPILIASDKSMNFKRENLCLLSIKYETGENELKKLIDKLFDVAEYFKSITNDESDISYSKGMWREDIAPMLGNSRVDNK